MTEDMVLDQENVLRSLGTTAISAKIRARMQSSAVISDMQAFKAANASALLEDFVRWHSPRDFIVTDSDPEKDLEAEHADGERKYQFVRCTVGSPDGYPIHQYQDGQDGDEADAAEPFQVAIWQFASGKFGHLSRRMRDAGNLWHELWKSAEPLAADRQKPLFDYTREAEKVLHYLENLPPGGFLQQILSVLLGTSMAMLDELYVTRQFEVLRDMSAGVHQTLTNVSGGLVFNDTKRRRRASSDAGRAADEADDVERESAEAEMVDEAFQDAKFAIEVYEATVAVALSLAHKLPSCPDVVGKLLKSSLAQVTTEAERKAIMRLFADKESASLSPDTREFIIESPAVGDTTGATNRMYASLAEHEMRVAFKRVTLS